MFNNDRTGGLGNATSYGDIVDNMSTILENIDLFNFSKEDLENISLALKNEDDIDSDNYEEYEDQQETLINWITDTSNYLFGSSNDFFLTRVCSSVSVLYSPEDIYLKEINLEDAIKETNNDRNI